MLNTPKKNAVVNILTRKSAALTPLYILQAEKKQIKNQEYWKAI